MRRRNPSARPHAPHLGQQAWRSEPRLGRALTACASPNELQEEWDDEEEGLDDELAELTVTDRAGEGDAGPSGGSGTEAPRPEDVDEFGFSKDGYDYSKHMREPGGGMWVPALAPGEKPAQAPIAREFVLRDEKEEREATAQVRAREGRAATLNERKCAIHALRPHA